MAAQRKEGETTFREPDWQSWLGKHWGEEVKPIVDNPENGITYDLFYSDEITCDRNFIGKIKDVRPQKVNEERYIYYIYLCFRILVANLLLFIIKIDVIIAAC